MTLTPKVTKAIEKAAQLHNNQSRKGKDYLPYISHPYSVALLLSRYTTDEDVIAAGLLHDILEDVDKYSIESMEHDFGERVVRIVKEVSENRDGIFDHPEKDPWTVCKERYINNLHIISHEGLMVSAADKIHNLNDTIQDFKNEGHGLWEKFSAPKEQQLWFYGAVLELLRERLMNGIVYEFEITYGYALRLFGEDK